LERDTLGHKRCPRCEQHKPTTEFYIRRRSDRPQNTYISSECKVCNYARTSRDRIANANRSRVSSAKGRAKRAGIPFDIVVTDLAWPTHCPALGIELDYSLGTKGSGSRSNSPSLDRVIPSLGYVKGNVIVVSQLANAIKTNATVEQIERVAAFYRQFISQEGSSHATETN
jgi:hypothetical protein